LKRETLILILLAGINFLQVLDFMIMMPLGSSLIESFDTDPKGFSLMVGSYSVSAAICGLSFSSIINNFDRKTILLFTCAGFAAMTLLCASATSVVTMSIYRALAGGFGVVCTSIVFSIVGDLIPYERRAYAMGIVSSGFGFASAIGVPTGLFLSDYYGWQSPFIAVSIMAALLIPVLYFLIPSMTDHLGDQTRGIREVIGDVLRNSNQVRALLFLLVLLIGQFALVQYLAAYNELTIGLTKGEIQILYFVGGVAVLLSAPVAGKIGDRIGKNKAFVLFLLLSLPSVAALTFTPKGMVLWAIVASTVFFVFGGARMIMATTISISTATPRERAGFMSIRSSIQHLGASIAAGIGGLVIVEDQAGELHNFAILGLISIVFALLTIPLVLKIKAVD
jgi:predicted MFS family arabinose efflux permease